MKVFRALGLLAAVALSAAAAQAGDKVAVIIANSNYSKMRDLPAAADAVSAREDLSRAGFEVIVIRDASRATAGPALREAREALADAQQAILFLSGYVVSSGWDNWLLLADAPRPDVLSVGANGISVNALMTLLADKAGAAAVLVGSGKAPGKPEDGLSYGFAAARIPQGITVISGETGKLLRILRAGLLVEGVTTRDVAEAAPDGVSVQGFVSASIPFQPEPVTGPNPREELDAWNAARDKGTADAVAAFLERFPAGLFAKEAQALLVELRKTPQDKAREAEEALKLSREDRRDIQRDLSLLGYDTRGIDGIFGRGTRSAIRSWQKANGYEPTGYLSADQLAALRSAAVVRARQLEEEARRRQEEQDRQDAAYWRKTGRTGTEEGLRDYLKHYPDGLYADIARERLAVFEEERRRTAAIAERNAWDMAKEADTIAAYRDFLKRFPDGAFAADARQRLAELEREASESSEKAKAMREEQSVLSNPITRLLVERQLDKLGLKPGRVDGIIDGDTRKAIRRFQRAAGLPVTGFVTQQTLVRLLFAKGD